MEKIYPRREPEKAKALLEKERPSEMEKQHQYVLYMLGYENTCPLCNEKCSFYQAADDDVAIGDAYQGECHCAHCGIGLQRVTPLVKNFGPGWYWMIDPKAQKELLALWLGQRIVAKTLDPLTILTQRGEP
jgi:hypothetical protein